MRAAIALLVCVGAGSLVHGAAAAPTAVPAPLLGDWGKTITLAKWAKHQINYEAAGHWAIEITKQGTSIHQPPGDTNLAPLTTMRASATGGTVVFGPTADGFCGDKATYRWKVSGRTLTLKLAKDDCTARAVLLADSTFRRQ
jgi:hypothetical protein